MDITSSSAMLFTTAALVIIIAVIGKVVRGRIMVDPVCNRPLPPVVSGVSIIGLIYTFLTKGFREMVQDQYTKLGSVFTISLFGRKITLLIGPEVSSHFYLGLDSEVSHGKSLEFTVPMFGKEVGYAVDFTTRNEQFRMQKDALKPSKLRSHLGPMLQEVQDFFAKWGQHGMVDLQQEIDQLLMLISGRCLLGKEIREMMLDEVITLFDQLFNNGLHPISLLFPYAPTVATRKRDRAHTRLSEMFSDVVRSRKSSKCAEEDVLQNLVDSKYKDGRPTTVAEVTGLIMSLIFAGKHTSSHSSTWTGACLLSHPRWLLAAIEEQEQIIRKYGDHVDYNALQEMDILHRCIKEALRMHTPGAIFFRKVHKNFSTQTKEGFEYEIPRGHIITSLPMLNNYIPYIYKNPNVYDPDRFGPGREEDKVGGKFSYTVFSAGRHACPGEAYAYMQIKAIWSHLLRNFELEMVSPFPKTNRWMVTTSGNAKGKIIVSYKRRPLPRI
ncbi:unnamed protein product [Urochloa humidicola]